MTERKKGYKQGDYNAQMEAKQLEGVSWLSWRITLVNHLVSDGLSFPNGEREEVLHQWFVLRQMRKLGKMSQEDFDQKKDALFEGKDEIFDDKAMSTAIRFITTKTEKVNS